MYVLVSSLNTAQLNSSIESKLLEEERRRAALTNFEYMAMTMTMMHQRRLQSFSQTTGQVLTLSGRQSVQVLNRRGTRGSLLVLPGPPSSIDLLCEVACSSSAGDNAGALFVVLSTDDTTLEARLWLLDAGSAAVSPLCESLGRLPFPVHCLYGLLAGKDSTDKSLLHLCLAGDGEFLLLSVPLLQLPTSLYPDPSGPVPELLRVTAVTQGTPLTSAQLLLSSHPTKTPGKSQTHTPPFLYILAGTAAGQVLVWKFNIHSQEFTEWMSVSGTRLNGILFFLSRCYPWLVDITRIVFTVPVTHISFLEESSLLVVGQGSRSVTEEPRFPPSVSYHLVNPSWTQSSVIPTQQQSSEILELGHLSALAVSSAQSVGKDQRQYRVFVAYEGNGKTQLQVLLLTSKKCTELASVPLSLANDDYVMVRCWYLIYGTIAL